MVKMVLGKGGRAVNMMTANDSEIQGDVLGIISNGNGFSDSSDLRC